MKIFGVLRLIILILCGLSFVSKISAQDWKQIVPLETTCDDIKVILNVKECSIPVASYKFKDFSLNINLSKGDDEYKVPHGTVTRVGIGLLNLPLLDDFINELGLKIEDFQIESVEDLPKSKVFHNERQGISIWAQQVWSNSDKFYVSNITLSPKAKNDEPRDHQKNCIESQQ